ncbi:cytochrome C oxidase subunit I [Devosia limi DSM 17137]|uniref:Cytochrome C oxidase subunit I n=1 Tax=Devosia limi DSM 17137 TaxID=1121477 RepID=A0A0F5L198_9HYPH|nr:DUF2189 domain-containing protein [Devosia limi]KKB76176.1 cytochrome C oxidase subunit I [Devosia limi DSM 17137]SHF20264.1 Uncharacterized membrane protein [Devosia limi DSM 17137]
MAHFHVIGGAGEKLAHPVVRKIGLSDLFDSLRQGAADFWEKPSHYVLLTLIYPIVGIGLAVWMSGYYTWPMLYPLVGGFALIGPFAALGLYEISRRREMGMDTSWRHAFDVLHSPALASIGGVAVMLFVVFTLWLTAAQTLYESLFGSAPPMALTDLINQILTSPQGWTLIVVGNLLGLAFAIFTLCTTVIAFPLLLDRDVGAFVAVQTSFRAVMKNPVPMAAWGIIVALGLALGMVPLFVGLAVVIPIFGHATWHLYRKVIEPEPSGRSRTSH